MQINKSNTHTHIKDNHAHSMIFLWQNNHDKTHYYNQSKRVRENPREDIMQNRYDHLSFGEELFQRHDKYIYHIWFWNLANRFIKTTSPLALEHSKPIHLLSLTLKHREPVHQFRVDIPTRLRDLDQFPAIIISSYDLDVEFFAGWGKVFSSLFSKMVVGIIFFWGFGSCKSESTTIR